MTSDIAMAKNYADGFNDGYNKGRDDREKEVLSYLVKNGYIKYGFDEEYLAEQMKGAEQ